jgi:hypothetical protein
MWGTATERMRGNDSSTQCSSTFHRAPSMKRPWMKAPSPGFFTFAASSWAGVSVAKSNAVWSIGIVYFRAKFWSVPVMKACQGG